MRVETIGNATLYTGDCLEILRALPDCSMNTCITSPPYFGLRDYGMDGQMGLEATPEAYVAGMVAVFREVRRVLRDDGTLWLNLGDSYCGYKGDNYGKAKGNLTARTPEAGESRIDTATPQTSGVKNKDLIGIPWRVAFALQADGWYLRQDIVWSKPNPMPESVTDRCTKSHEYIFMLSKSARYYYDQEAIKEPMSVSSGARLSRDIEGQPGSNSVPGKTNGPMKAVGKTDKQRGHGRRHAGFNDRWDAMPKDEQCSGMRNKRSVWTVSTKPFKGAHFATFPPELITPCVMAGCPAGGVVLDPFSGSGTTGQVALEQGRGYVGIELNPEYQALAVSRITPFAQQERLFA